MSIDRQISRLEAEKRMLAEQERAVKGNTRHVLAKGCLKRVRAFVQSRDFRNCAGSVMAHFNYETEKAMESGEIALKEAVSGKNLLEQEIKDGLKTACEHLANFWMKTAGQVKTEFSEGPEVLRCVMHALAKKRDAAVDLVYRNGKAKQRIGLYNAVRSVFGSREDYENEHNVSMQYLLDFVLKDSAVGKLPEKFAVIPRLAKFYAETLLQRDIAAVYSCSGNYSSKSSGSTGSVNSSTSV